MSFAAASLNTYRCCGCGYGASCRHEPERCPMCGGIAWDALARMPLDVTTDLVAAARRAAARAGGDADAPLVRELAEVSVFPGVPLS
jgi:rubredoxin